MKGRSDFYIDLCKQQAQQIKELLERVEEGDQVEDKLASETSHLLQEEVASKAATMAYKRRIADDKVLIQRLYESNNNLKMQLEAANKFQKEDHETLVHRQQMIHKQTQLQLNKLKDERDELAAQLASTKAYLKVQDQMLVEQRELMLEEIHHKDKTIQELLSKTYDLQKRFDLFQRRSELEKK